MFPLQLSGRMGTLGRHTLSQSAQSVTGSASDRAAGDSVGVVIDIVISIEVPAVDARGEH